MAATSHIEWTDATWQPITGCTLVSEGCANCYAAELAAGRLKHHPSRAGLARRNAAGVAKFTGEVRFNEQWLSQPLTWRDPKRVFVCAHSDLFHEAVPDEWIDRVFAVMALCPQHTFQVLTKRPERAVEFFGGGPGDGWGKRNSLITAAARTMNPAMPEHWTAIGAGQTKHIWFGTSAEDQAAWEARREAVLRVGGWFGCAFLSAEPLLGPINLDFRWDHCDLCGGTGKLARWPKGQCHICGGKGKMLINGAPDRRGYHHLDWVIVGGESGKHARPMHPDWARAPRSMQFFGHRVLLQAVGGMAGGRRRGDS
jgi:protein gp37